MRLLIITQKVDINDDVLGFFHRWVEKFAEKFEKITVICLQKGEYNLPKNVRVLSLGKEQYSHHSHVIRRLVSLYRFYKYIWNLRKEYNGVWVHMNYEYVILGALLWKLLKKKIGLWYAHGHAPFLLRTAEKFADVIFTSTSSGFRLASKKMQVVGQGIDIEKFKPADKKSKDKSLFKVITIGRISPVKDYETLIKAVGILLKNNSQVRVDIIGGIGTPGQESYLSDLKKTIHERQLDSVINFLGPLPNQKIVKHLQFADLFVNMSHTGSLDKAILEAMGCGLPILTCNESLVSVLKEYKEKLMYPKKNYQKLAEKIQFMIDMGEERNKIGMGLRKIVIKDHNLEGLVAKIINGFKIQ